LEMKYLDIWYNDNPEIKSKIVLDTESGNYYLVFKNQDQAFEVKPYVRGNQLLIEAESIEKVILNEICRFD
jgi:hypothetical protein